MSLTIAVGLFIGVLGRILTGKNSGGILTQLLLAVGGSSIAAATGELTGLYTEASFAGFTTSVIGAAFFVFTNVAILNKRSTAN